MASRILLCLVFYIISIASSGQAIDQLLLDYNTTRDSVQRTAIEEKLAWIYQDQEAYARAIEFYKKALKGRLYDTLRAQKIRVGMAFCYHELGEPDAEIEVRKEILAYGLHDKRISVANMQALSTLFLELKKYDQAIEYTELLLQEATILKDYQLITQAYNNLGYIFHLKNDSKKSSAYFNKSYEVTTTKGISIKNSDRVKILINLGVINANLGQTGRAQGLFAEAVDIAKKDGDSVSLARALNFTATGHYLRGQVNKAIDVLKESMGILEKVAQTGESDAIRAEGYKLMAELMLNKNDIQSFRFYQKQYNELRENTLQYQKRRYRLLLERQLETEEQEREVQRLMAENQNNRIQLVQSELSALQKERELEAKLKELAILKNENDLQAIRYQNELLEKEKMSQLLEITEQKAAAAEQEQKIKLLQQDKKLQDFTLAKNKKEIELLENTKQQQLKIKEYSFIIIALLLALLLIVIGLYYYRNRKDLELAKQNQMISSLNNEMATQNEELTALNDTLNDRTVEVEKQNLKLTQAQEIIDNQNKKLLSYSRNLEAEIDRRVKEIKHANKELIRYNNQLEQFAFTVSHNLRGPIARLMGLTNLLLTTQENEQRNFMLTKVAESSIELDEVIKDLVKILDIKYSTQLMIEPIDLHDRAKKTLTSLEHVVKKSNTSVIIDFSEVNDIQSVGAYIDSILYNLISNAIKYRSPNRPCEIILTTKLQNNSITLIVKDNGIGIDLERYGGQLFGLYRRFNTHIEGKGIGLYLVKAQVESLNGSIEVSSAVNEGTTFIVTFPLLEESANNENVT
jgi:signal transduction histidine kinase/tetratricopeptide (TPR) repeat protein